MRRILGMMLLMAAIGTLNASKAHAQVAFGFGVGGPIATMSNIIPRMRCIRILLVPS